MSKEWKTRLVIYLMGFGIGVSLGLSIHSQREDRWRELALRATASVDQCVETLKEQVRK